MGIMGASRVPDTMGGPFSCDSVRMRYLVLLSKELQSLLDTQGVMRFLS